MFWELLRQRRVDLGGCPPWSPPLGWSAEMPHLGMEAAAQACCLSMKGFSGHRQAAPWVTFLVGILSSDGGWLLPGHWGIAGAFLPLSLVVVPCSP